MDPSLQQNKKGDLDLEKVVNLPSIPTVFSKVCSIVNDSGSSIIDLTKAIELDQAVAAKALRIANSAAFGLYARVKSLHHACALLGMRMIRNVVLQTSLMSQYDKLKRLKEFDMDAFWRHTILTATISRDLSKHLKKTQITQEDAYTAGLLHDIGALVLLENRTKPYLEAVRHSQENNIPLHEAERALFGFDHASIGAFLARKWGFPEEVAASIQQHHGAEVGSPYETLAILVSSSNLFAHAIDEARLQDIQGGLDPRLMEALDLDSEKLAEFLLQMSELASTLTSEFQGK